MGEVIGVIFKIGSFIFFGPILIVIVIGIVLLPFRIIAELFNNEK